MNGLDAGRSLGKALLIKAMVLLPSVAIAADAITYSYDPLGRVVGAVSSGSVNDGVSLTYTYDAAGNRVTYEVAGSAKAGVPERIVVVIPSNPPSPSPAMGYAV